MTSVISSGLVRLVKVAYHLVEARRQRLAELLREHAYLPVSELCRRLKISESTARRDLAVLAKAHKIRRTYGGALLEYAEEFDSFQQRQTRAKKAKQMIAGQARPLVRSGMRLYLDGGTTLHYVALALAAAPALELFVLTNNVQIADLLGDYPNFEVELAGGRFLKRQGCCLGPVTERTIHRNSFDLAFLGAEAVNARGIYNSVQAIVRVQKIAMKQAAQIVLCFDATKLLAEPPESRLGKLHEFHHILTDASADQLAELRVAEAA